MEKRIYGLQQLCEKINDASSNDNFPDPEWLSSKNLGQFLRTNNVFQDVFSHNELIKRSFPLLRFLYQQGQFDDIVSLLKMVEGKHEASANMIYKVLNDLAEIVNPKDISILVDEVCTINEADSNILTFIKALGRNSVFDVLNLYNSTYI